MKHYPNQLNSLKAKLASKKIPARLIFFVLGIASTIWFLLRVIPKPQRAAYPCMRVAAPFMSSFVIYLLSLSGIVLAFRQSKKKFFQAKYLAAAGFLLISVISAVVYFANNTAPAKAATPPDAPNTPMGVAQGIMPGRVAWARCEDAICQGMDCKIGAKGTMFDTIKDHVYYNPRYAYQPAIDSMINSTILALANETDYSAAWDTIFRFFNKKKKGAPAGYKTTEKIFIKLNLTGGSSIVAMTAYWGRMHTDLKRINATWQAHPDLVESNQYSVLSILRQLVYEAGVPDSMITIGDPIKNVYQDYYDYWKKEFPGVKVLANKYLASSIDPAALGRTAVVRGTADRVFYSSGGITDKLYTVLEEADYLIDMAVLKAHNRNGITLCAKNFFGCHIRSDASHLHSSLIAPNEWTVTNGSYEKYRVLVDLLGNKYLGGNTLLYIVDGLVSAEKDWDGPAIKFKMAPFNNTFPASMFVSLDPVALESVCFDILRTEFDPANSHTTNSPYTYTAIDDYLHQAADSTTWPAGVKYKPNGDGLELPSLGAHEHWNNATDMKYSRNLDAVNGKGIELYKITFAMPHVWDTAAPVDTTARIKPNAIAAISLYPNPAASVVNIGYEVKTPSLVTIEISGLNGQKVAGLVNQRLQPGTYTHTWDAEDIKAGVYICRVCIGSASTTKKITIIK